MSAQVGFQARSKRTSLESLPIRSYRDQFDPTLDGRWRWVKTDPTLPKPPKGEKQKPVASGYFDSNDVVARYFHDNKVCTVQELELLETLAGQAPERVPLSDAFGCQFLFPNQASDIAEGESLTARLVDPSQKEEFVKLFTESHNWPEGESRPPEWVQRARKVKIVVTIAPTPIDHLIDTEMVEFDIERIEKKRKAEAKQPVKV